jgi:cytoskeletal protein RodZ
MATHDENPAHTPPKSIVPIFIGGLFMIALFALAVRLLMAWTPDLPDEDAARGAERTKAREELTTANQQRLQEWGWADKAAGTVQMPITVAMQRTIETINSSTPQPAGPVNPNAAPAPAAPEVAASPAASPAPTEPPAASQPEASPAPAP